MDNEWLTHGYDAYGRPVTLTGDDDYVTDASYDTHGRLTEVAFGNGVRTSYSYWAPIETFGTRTLGHDDPDHPHAVTLVFGQTRYHYDANGNMTSRHTPEGWQTLAYDEENRIESVTGPTNASFLYDAVGARVRRTVGMTTTWHFGEVYEWDGASGTSYYFFGGQRVAMRDSGGVSDIHGDHLTSATNTTGAETSGAQYYYPYGAQRGGNVVDTPYRYTGQREEADLGFYDYKARWYDPAVGRFLQTDTVVPEAGNPQAYNRQVYGMLFEP